MCLTHFLGSFGVTTYMGSFHRWVQSEIKWVHVESTQWNCLKHTDQLFCYISSRHRNTWCLVWKNILCVLRLMWQDQCKTPSENNKSCFHTKVPRPSRFLYWLIAPVLKFSGQRSTPWCEKVFRGGNDPLCEIWKRFPILTPDFWTGSDGFPSGFEEQISNTPVDFGNASALFLA